MKFIEPHIFDRQSWLGYVSTRQEWQTVAEFQFLVWILRSLEKFLWNNDKTHFTFDFTVTAKQNMNLGFKKASLTV